MSIEKKRVNIYVEVEKYDRFKKLLDIMGITVTDFMNNAMDDFINTMEQAVLNQNKDVFLEIMSRNIDSIQEQIEEELKK
jgi:predicted component of type VI protein secretion system